MKFADNLYFLRKRDKITQEDLAEKLNVSRQSVSKWETGEAYPETEKLLVLCDLFNVSLDDLMRGDLTEQSSDIVKSEPVDTVGSERTTEYAVYDEHMNKFSRGISLGVLLIILGVAVCIMLSGISFLLSGAMQELVSIMSGVAVILFVAAAVFLFVLCGNKHESFKKDNPVVAEPKERVDDKNFGAKTAGLVSGILIDVVYLIVMTSLVDANIIRTNHADAATCYIVSAFMAVLAFIVFGLVYLGIQRSKTNIKEYNKQARSALSPSPKEKLIGAICGAVMMTATAIFLLLGFIGNYWHPGWVVFPVGGILCGIISTLLRAKNTRE